MSLEDTVNAPTTEYISQLVIRRLVQLQAKSDWDEDALSDYQTAHSLLESILMSTDDFLLACTRLENAERYLHHAEPGAARYELQLLVTNLSTNQP